MPCCRYDDKCGGYVSFYRKFNHGKYCAKHAYEVYLQKEGSYWALFKDVKNDKGIIVAVALAIVDLVQSTISITDSPGLRRIFHDQPLARRDLYRGFFVLGMIVFSVLSYFSYFHSWARYIILVLSFWFWLFIVSGTLMYEAWKTFIFLRFVMPVLVICLVSWNISHGFYISILFAIPQILTILTMQLGTLLFSKHFMAAERSILFAMVNYVECILLFSLIYLAMPYQFNKPINESIEKALYYSMVTITTLGYGDIEPICWMSRMVSGIESIVGIFFIALIVGFFLNHLSENKI